MKNACPYGDSATTAIWQTRAQLEQPHWVRCSCGASVPIDGRLFGPDLVSSGEGAWVKLPAHERGTGRLNGADARLIGLPQHDRDELRRRGGAP